MDFFGTFIAGLRGEGEPLVSTEDAFAITRICLRARDAADTGTWVKLYRKGSCAQQNRYLRQRSSERPIMRMICRLV